MICLLVRTDGRRECIERAMTSFDEMVEGHVTRRVIHDDSGDTGYTNWLFQRFPGFEIIATDGRSGFAAAIQSAWRYLEDIDEPYVFDCEDDFVYSQPVDLEELVDLLVCEPHLAQIALRRQPVGTEPSDGGFIAQAPQWYTERLEEGVGITGLMVRHWIETRRNWTTNNSLYCRDLVHVGWPDAPDSEGYFGFALKEDIGLPWGVEPGAVQFGIWGAIDDPPAIEHIGLERVGVGY